MYLKVMESYINHLRIECGLSAATVDAYRADLEAYTAFCGGVAATDLSMIQSWLASLSKAGQGSRSVARRASSIRAYLRFIGRGDVSTLVESPRMGKRLPDFLNEADCVKLTYCPDDQTDIGVRDQAVLELLYGAGLRATELCSLKVEDVELRERLIHVRQGKGGKDRQVPINNFCAGAVKRYIDSCRSDGPTLFTSAAGRPLSRVDVYRLVRKHGRNAGIVKKVHPHMLRHSFATHLVSGGADLRYVTEMMGHGSAETTAVYVHCDTKRLKATHALLGR